MAETTDNSRLHASVHGRVQGVGFRYFVVESANQLQLTGWVRNRFDSSVEVVAEGARQTLDTLVTDLKRGPRASNVTEVKVSWEPASGEFSGFNAHRTG